MTDNIAVVRPYYATEQAYRMGYERFSDAAVPDPEHWELSAFTDSAEYCHTVLPRLRSMAGYDDDGYGTYQSDRRVAAIEPGAEEDRPAEAELTHARHIFNDLVSAYQKGAYDAVAEEEPAPPEPA